MSEQRLIGHYRIVELLGSGAMGKVHVAVDTFIEREVAIKSLRAELTQDPEFVGRFKAEATSLARLNHPNITTLYSPLFDGKDLYMVMELVRGRALDDIMRDRNGPLGVKESLAIIAQAADGISYAHQMGVIHRDIKPSNLMIAEDGRVKIMDFGIARVRGSVRLTRAGTAIGTPLYMAPEQRRGSEGDERSDLYSLATVLYELLSGAPPFAGLDEVDLLQAQIHTEPPALVPRVPGVTPELEAAIMTALAKRPEQRFPSVRAFSDAIGATVLRIDATGIVQSPAHLLEAPSTTAETGGAANLPSVALAVAKSRSTTLVRRFKGLHPAAQGVTVAVAAFALVSPLLFGSDPSPGPKKREADWSAPEQTSRLDQGGGRSRTMEVRTYGQKQQGYGDDRDAPARLQKTEAVERLSQKDDCNGNFGVGDCQPSSVPVYRQSQATRQPEKVALGPAASIADLRKAITGNASERIRASHFDKVTDDDKSKLLPLTKSLAGARDREAQFVLGMLLLEAPGGRQDLEGAYQAFKDAADQKYPDAQVNVGLMYQKGVLRGGQDHEKAAFWFLSAAESGDPKAQFWLGCYYQYGWGGLGKDRNKAVEKFSRAIAGDYRPATEALAFMTGTARGVSPCNK